MMTADRIFKSFALIFVLACMLSSGVKAAVTYSYSGNAFDSIYDEANAQGLFVVGDRVTGSFTLAAPLLANRPRAAIPVLNILSWSLQSGHGINISSTDVGAILASLEIGTNANAEITSWDFIAGIDYLGDLGVVQERVFTRNIPNRGVNDIARYVTIDDINTQTPVTGFDEGVILRSPGRWTVTQVPEAPTVALTLIGLMMLGLSRKGLARRLSAR